MAMHEGDRWICSNPGCRCEIQVIVSAGSTNANNPTCACGFVMKKEYIAPRFRAIRNPHELKQLQELFISKVR